MSRAEAIQAVTDIMLDGSRSDRFLAKCDSDNYYTTAENFNSMSQVHIFCLEDSSDVSDEEIRESAEMLVYVLDHSDILQ
jgi:hypothetical protein